MISLGHLSDIVVIDDFENPYMITDVKEFFDNIFSIYAEASNAYHQKVFDLKSKRTIPKIMDIE